jgi:hypothetical protein
MFNLSYLPTDRKRQLRKLQEKLATDIDHRARNETNLLIQEIMAEAKPYLSCDKYQLHELKNQLLDSISTLSQLGKRDSVESFQMHLKDVDFRLQTLMMEEALAEKDKLKSEEGPNLRERSTTLTELKREHKKKKQEARGHTRWTIGMEDE